MVPRKDIDVPLQAAKQWRVEGDGPTGPHGHTRPSPLTGTYDLTETLHHVRASGGGQLVASTCPDRRGRDEGTSRIERYLHRNSKGRALGGKPGHDPVGLMVLVVQAASATVMAAVAIAPSLLILLVVARSVSVK
jgi:hypothetical protein